MEQAAVQEKSDSEHYHPEPERSGQTENWTHFPLICHFIHSTTHLQPLSYWEKNGAPLLHC